MNELILGDNLEVLRQLPADSVDLIYLDPPFFSNRTYEVIWGDAGERRSFEDRWSGGIMQYIDWLNERVRELHRILSPPAPCSCTATGTPTLISRFSSWISCLAKTDLTLRLCGVELRLIPMRSES